MDLLKKEFLLAYLIIIAFGFFLFNVDVQAEMLVQYFTKESFYYYKPAYLGTFHIILGIICLALLMVLNRNENATAIEKGKAFSQFIFGTALSFFPGWIIHLYFIVQTVKMQGSFMTLEQNFLVYYPHEIGLFIGFCLAGFFVLRPVIHK